MGGLLTSLNTPYTGLSAHQVMVDTTSNNIANANSQFYSRQMVHAAPETPLWKQNYALGQGVQIMTIERAHDEFTYQRYKKADSEKQYFDTTFSNLREASAYYPEIENVGIYNDIQKYFDAWTAFAKNPGEPATKLSLATYTETLTNDIKYTRQKLYDLQQKLNKEMKTAVEQVNSLGQKIADLNRKIMEYERQDINKRANDLRDLRDQYEFQINELMGGDVYKSKIKGSDYISDTADFAENYTLVIGGKEIVDGVSFHPITLDNSQNPDGLYSILYTRSDHKTSNMINALNEGKVGAILNLIKTDEMLECNGDIGLLQKYINDLDTFANGLIESTNNIYAESARTSMQTDILKVIDPQGAIVDSDYNIHRGSFDVVMYDKNGNELGKRTVHIDGLTSMSDIVDQLNANLDDNGNMNAQDDFDDYFTATWSADSRSFSIGPKNPSLEIYISVQDNGTNFAGAIGLNRFFDGENARDIELAREYREDPTLLRAYKQSVEGNFEVANKIQQLQYEKTAFTGVYDGIEYEYTISQFFGFIAGKVANDTQQAQIGLETKTSVFVNVQKEFQTFSQVSVDEELVNLIKFQSGYSANAKVVNTISTMLDTLLGLKT